MELKKPLHLTTGTTQYGYRQGLSTLGAIVEIEQHTQEGTKATHVLLMDLPNAFDTINRNQLWATLYKKGLPVEIITNIRQGHQITAYAQSIISNMEQNAQAMSAFPMDQQSAH